MQDKYFKKMFEEFKKAYGICDTFDNFNKYLDLFAEWVTVKRKAATNYVQLFDYMENYDEIQTHTMAEFGKGAYDTIAIEMATHTNYLPIVISPYAQTIKKDSGIEAFTGELIILNGSDVIVRYPSKEDYSINPNCHSAINDDIGTFMTQVPYSDKELLPFLHLIDSNKTIFIGTYGALSDKNRKDNLQRLSNLYHQLSYICCRNVNFCSETLDNSYLSAIKINSKEKVLKKHFYYMSNS